MLSLAETARVILSQRLAHSLDALLVDLRSNAAAACLKIEDWDGAIEASSAVLEQQPKHTKALYRRARAKAALGQVKAAQADVQALLIVEPGNAAGKKLRDELASTEVEIV